MNVVFHPTIDVGKYFQRIFPKIKSGIASFYTKTNVDELISFKLIKILEKVFPPPNQLFMFLGGLCKLFDENAP